MIRIFDMLDTVREILSGCLDIYLSTTSNRLNEVMKVLTVLATILGVLTLITGFYGMNFVHIPWLDSVNAFRNILLFMVGCTVAMLVYFRWRKWL
jgi:magnesium transporter